jgi:two-component system response regulator YesN
MIRFVEGTLESIQDNSRRLLKLKISFVLAKELSEWYEVAEKFEALQLVLNRSYYLGQEVLLTEESFQQEMTADHQRAGLSKIIKKVGRLEDNLEGGQKEEFFETFNDLIAVANEDVPTLRVVMYHQLVVMFISYMTKAGCFQTFSETFNMTRLTHYESHGSWEEAIRFFRDLAERNFELKLTDAQQHSHHLVQRIKQYIEQNLGGDLSLTRIGELLSLNPYYLSRLYKQLTGEILTETITEVRLDRAKKLLISTNLKIIDISSQVGFESNAYFHRFFKKATNLTPHEFRESVKSYK